MPLLTKEEFDAVPSPVYYMRFDGPKWNDVERAMIQKWMAFTLSGWYYIDIKPASAGVSSLHTYLFEKSEDRMALALWLKGDPFSEDYGEILPYADTDIDFE